MLLKNVVYVVVSAILNVQLSTLAYGVKTAPDSDLDELNSGNNNHLSTSINVQENEQVEDKTVQAKEARPFSFMLSKLSKYIVVPLLGEWLDFADFCKLTAASTNTHLQNPLYILNSEHEHFSTVLQYIAASYKDYISDDEWQTLIDAKSIKAYLAKQHLRVLVNASTDLEEIGRLIATYGLGPSQCPLRDWMNKFLENRNDFEQDREPYWGYWEEGALLGNKAAQQRKMLGFIDGSNGYPSSPQEAKRYNDLLIEEGDLEAIARKVKGLATGFYGYEKNPEEARQYNEALIAADNNDLEAIARKVNGLCCEVYGYLKDEAAARKVFENFIDEGNPIVFPLLDRARLFSTDSFIRDPAKLRALNDRLIALGDQGAIVRKVDGLTHGRGGYEKNPEEARQYNEALIAADNNDLEAIARKVNGLCCEVYGYLKDEAAVREVFENFIDEGNPIVFSLLKFPFWDNSLVRDLAKVRALNDRLVARGDQGAIARKVHGLSRGMYGYPTRPEEARQYNEELIEADNNPEAIERKASQLVGEGPSGQYGYARDLDEYEKFMDFLCKQVREKINTPEFQEKRLGAIKFLLRSMKYTTTTQKNVFIADFCDDSSSLVIEGGRPSAIGNAVKALCLKHGMLEYLKDAEGARQLIMDHKIPY